jgi:hypothetical protein
MAIPYLACMLAASGAFHLPPRVLPSIQSVEGGRPGLVHRNADGSADLGVMQVNSWWVPRLAAVLGEAPEVTSDRLRDDPCFNIRVGAAIMQLCLRESGGDLMRAVGLYHSHNPALADDYLQRVLGAARAMFVHRTRG